MISPSRLRAALPLALRIALGAVFVYAAWVKLRTPWQLFAGAIADYKVLPDWAVIPLARSLPWAELAIGALLVAGRWFLRTASTAGSLLLVVFFALMVRAFVTGAEISCGCFGPGELISWRTLLRDGTLLAASLAVTWISFARRSSRSTGFPRGIPPTEASQPADRAGI
jgi:uncharacterized membrane protein YphA (DoxX/SURF4 family)